jgi:hypothetical protein
MTDTDNVSWCIFDYEAWNPNGAQTETASIAFDRDGTAGHVEWQKANNAPYTMAEMVEHLKQASHTVIWKRVNHGRRTPNFKNQAVAAINWEGRLHGGVIFMASYRTEGSNDNILAIGNYAD